MAIITLGKAEIKTSDLGVEAFEGHFEKVQSKLNTGINWSEEGSQILEGALYGKHSDLALLLLKGGSPVRDATYFIAFDYLPGFLHKLPANPELLKKVKASRLPAALAWALINQKTELVQELISQGAPLNQSVLITHGMGNQYPIHYAVRHGNLTLIKMVIQGGADLNVVNPEGKSALRIIMENDELNSDQKRGAIKILKDAGANSLPEVKGIKNKLRLLLGKRIR